MSSPSAPESAPPLAPDPDAPASGAELLPNTGILSSLFGASVFDSAIGRRLKSLSDTRFVILVSVVFGLFLYVPYLGAVGLWDPWETHYGEVGRMMLWRSDFVYPWWESAWFFSKPPLTMWLQALGMWIVGTNRTEGALALYTEWGMRLPFALFAVASLALLTLALSRIINRRVAFATMFVLGTMPLYFLLTRQTVTDTPFVSCLVSAMSCAMIAQFDDKTKHRTAWWYGFYVFAGLGLLAKSLPGLLLPYTILFVYACICVIPWKWDALSEHVRWLSNADNVASIFLSDFESYRRKRTPPPVLWQQFFNMRLLTGLIVCFLAFGPWLLVMCAFDAVDDENKKFAYRFFIHDNFARLTSGVHTTTPGGTFTYFVEQGGFAIFPWVALVPGALVVASRIRPNSLVKGDHVAMIAVAWTAIAFMLYSSSATKFHHYVFPVLPGAAILIALYIDKLWTEGVLRHVVPIIFGLLLFVLVAKDLTGTPKHFTDLFVYNYDRPYPTNLVEDPLLISDVVKPVKWLSMSVADGRLMQGHILALVMLLLGGYLLLESFAPPSNKKKPAAPAPANDSAIFTRITGVGLAAVGLSILVAMRFQLTVSPSLFVGLGVAAAGVYIFVAVNKLPEADRAGVTAVGGLLALLGLGLVMMGLNRQPAQDVLRTSLIDSVNIKSCMKYLFAVGGLLSMLAVFWRARTMLYGAFGIMTLLFALWFNWSHWPDLSHHWTQRDQFWRYYAQRKPGEPITSFLMNWRGETFYSKNQVKQIKDNGRLYQYAQQPGREWALVEHYRFGILKQAVGPDKTVTMIDRDLNNKFVLVTIDGP